MKNIKYIICLSVLLFVSLESLAQNRVPNNSRNGRDSISREVYMVRRNTYITEKIGLTAQEAAAFIPMENDFLRKKFEIGRDCRRYERELGNKKVKTDEDYKKLLQCQEDAIEKDYQLNKDYFEKFKKVLSAEKILKYKNAERAFMDEFFRDRR